MVVAALDGFDELGHHESGDAGVLELVAARADRDIEAVEVGAVVDRNPVVASVVAVDDSALLMGKGNAEGGHALVDAQGVGLPPLVGELAEFAVGIDDFARVAGRIGGADEDVVAGLGSEVDAVVVVRDGEADLGEVGIGWAGHVVRLVADRLGFDVHRVVDPGEAVDVRAVRSGDVHHDLGVDA